jgi:hypothetical protein
METTLFCLTLNGYKPLKPCLRMAKTCACGKPAAPQRSICYKCRSRNIVQKNPIRALFYELRRSAKRRSYEFTLTLEFFTEFINNSDLLNNRGRGVNAYTIDRIRNEEGYTPTNIQILTKSENSEKYWEEFRQNRDLPNFIEPGEEVIHQF